MGLIIDKPLGQINTSEAAALTIIRGVHPKERARALAWFRLRANQRKLSKAVLRAIEKFIEDEENAGKGVAKRFRAKGARKEEVTESGGTQVSVRTSRASARSGKAAKRAAKPRVKGLKR